MTVITKIESSSVITHNKKLQEKPEKVKVAKTDSIQISNTARVYDKVDKFMNLGSSERLGVADLNREERKEFLKIVSALIKKGVVGFEVLEVNGKPEKHFIENEIGDQRLKGAKLYKKKDLFQIKRSD